MNKKAIQLLQELHKGGGWGFYWTLPDKKTHWFESGQPGEIPDAEHVYFGVHPSNKNGGTNQRSTADSIRAINCLYADFDAKDRDKSELLIDIALLSAPPSVLIDSGGGYHAYWLLESTYPLNTSGQRERADKIQKQWVSYVGADDGAKDLARVLRVPGTENRKYEPARPVEFVEGFDIEKRYSLDFLELISEPQESKEKAAPVQTAQDNGAGEYWLERAADMAHVGLRNETGFWLACQLRDARLSFGDAENIMRTYAQNVTTSGEPYKESEALASLKSAYSKAAREPVQSSPKPQAGGAVNLDAMPEGVNPDDIKPSTWADIEKVLGPITWSWENWLPDGMLTIVASKPGIGKSSLCLRIAASFLTGAEWPDGTKFDQEQGKVLWCEAESAQAINLDRAKRWGLPTKKILTPVKPLEDVRLEIAHHKGALATLAMRDDIKLIIIDSLRGVLSGDENSSETSDLVMWLASLARDSGKPILLTHHLRKRGLLDSGDNIDLDRLRGSSAIVQAARVVWALDTPNPQEKDWVRLSVIKNNLAEFAEPVGMAIDENIRFGVAPQAPKQETASDKMRDLLLDLLRSEPRPSKEIYAEVEGAGLSIATAKRVKKDLGISSIRKDDGWYWSLSTDDNPPLL